MKNLSEQLVKVDNSLQSLSTERTELLSEIERLNQKAKTELAVKLEEHDQEVTELKAEIESVRANLRRCEDALRSKEKAAESLTSSLQVQTAVLRLTVSVHSFRIKCDICCISNKQNT